MRRRISGNRRFSSLKVREVIAMTISEICACIVALVNVISFVYDIIKDNSKRK